MQLLDIDTRSITKPEDSVLNDIEVAPIYALDDDLQPTTYDKAKSFERGPGIEDSTPSAFSVYWHIVGQGARWIADFATAEEARKLAQILADRYTVEVMDYTAKES